MSINFIPNDPRAGAAAPVLRVQTKRANRPATRSGFKLVNPSPEGKFEPGTPSFLFWQCREAALAALQAWEAAAGKHTRWQGNRTKLPLLQDNGIDVNAFYDRASFSFFHQTIGNATFFSGASTDVVAHEVGHGLLDSVRPEFFDVNFLEVGAFHEAFGDSMAVLTALEDLETRTKLLTAGANLLRRNFLESTAEDLSEGIRRLVPSHNAAKPRHAFNSFKYQLPETLPSSGGPGALINEVHSFGMLFTGCFWGLIANLFSAAPTKNPTTLLKAARTAGAILIAGAKTALVTPRFLQSVGRAMILADQTLHAGANRDPIRNAFAKHNVLLGTNAMLAPAMMLSGHAPRGNALGLATRKDLLNRLGGAARARLAVTSASIAGTGAMQAQYTRDVSLNAVDQRLKGVVALGHEMVMIGDSGGRAAILGAMPNAADTEGEVRNFVRSLLQHDAIEFGGATKKSAHSAAKQARGHTTVPTHTIRSVAGRKILSRTRFQCECCFWL